MRPRVAHGASPNKQIGLGFDDGKGMRAAAVGHGIQVWVQLRLKGRTAEGYQWVCAKERRKGRHTWKRSTRAVICQVRRKAFQDGEANDDGPFKEGVVSAECNWFACQLLYTWDSGSLIVLGDGIAMTVNGPLVRLHLMMIRARIMKEGAKRQHQRSDNYPGCSCPRYDIDSHRGRGIQLPGTKFLRLPTTRTETKRRLASLRFRISGPWRCFRCYGHPVHDCCPLPFGWARSDYGTW